MAEIIREFEVNVPASQAWDVLGTNFAQIHTWASGVHHSSGDHNTRACQTSMGAIRETVTEFDDRQMRLSYDAKGEKMPFFVKRLTNHWAVTPVGNKQSKVSMQLEMDLLPPFGFFPGPLLKMKMGSFMDEAIEELRFYLEHGEPHPRKVAARKQK